MSMGYDDDEEYGGGDDRPRRSASPPKVVDVEKIKPNTEENKGEIRYVARPAAAALAATDTRPLCLWYPRLLGHCQVAVLPYAVAPRRHASLPLPYPLAVALTTAPSLPRKTSLFASFCGCAACLWKRRTGSGRCWG